MIRPLVCQLLLPLRSCAVSLTSASSLHLTAPSSLTMALHIFIDVVVETIWFQLDSTLKLMGSDLEMLSSGIPLVLLSARNGGERVNFGLYVFFPFYAVRDLSANF
ncbi:hypothetical protein OROMI_016590 [Orobanche minor]